VARGVWRPASSVAIEAKRLFPLQADRVRWLQTQKSPQGLCHAGFQDFSERFWYRRERILVELAGVEPASEITTPSVLHA